MIWQVINNTLEEVVTFMGELLGGATGVKQSVVRLPTDLTMIQ